MYTFGSAMWAGHHDAPIDGPEAGSGSLSTRHELTAEEDEYVQQYIDAVAQLHACGENSLVSVILFGSAASGAFSESSDVDLVLVLPNEAALEDRRRLREAVSDLEVAHGLRSDPAPWIAKDGWPKQKE